jgi:hypothetical protein
MRSREGTAMPPMRTAVTRRAFRDPMLARTPWELSRRRPYQSPVSMTNTKNIATRERATRRGKSGPVSRSSGTSSTSKSVFGGSRNNLGSFKPLYVHLVQPARSRIF